MKRTVSLILALSCLIGCLCVFGTASADVETWYVKTGNGKSLNVRDVNTEKIIGRLPYGSSVQVEYFTGSWAIILWGSYGDAKVKKEFLVSKKPAAYSGPTNTSGTPLTDSALGSETVAGLNRQYSSLKYVESYNVRVVPDTRTGTARLRWAPSKNSQLITLLPANYELEVLAANSNWLMVKEPVTGKIGYIATKYTTR